jgi:CMP-N-acetylneuraminic acid synthetase
MKSNIVAIIPVREGSKRVKNKNFKKFANEKSLLELKIKQLKKQNCFKKIYLSSNSKTAKKIAIQNNINFLYRPDYYCSSNAKMHEYNSYMLSTIPGDPDVAWTMVTAPLFYDYKKAISKYYKSKNQGFDSLITVCKFNEFLINSKSKPINCSFGMWHSLTQDLPKLFTITGGVYIAKKSDQLKWNYWFGMKPFMMKISKLKSIDVDTTEDFKIAQALFLSFKK